ncbi:MAG: ABC transporter ATP-binding protein [Desulfurococcus sp.]|nr:ABC transporter ATP-binding protein [Desulfurococcus sp.]
MENVVKKYAGSIVLKNISLSISEGSRVVIVGPNGSGKTTLIKILLGLTGRDSGVVKVFGIDPSSRKFDEMRRNIGYLPEKTTLIQGMRVEDYLDYVSSIKGCYGYEDVLDQFNLVKYRRYKLKALSQGYKRRVLLAASLLCKPRLLILDEPYANIDLETKLVIDDLLNNIAREHITMLMTTHIEPSLNNYTAIVMINGEIIGKIEMENTIKLTLMCSGEKIELTERELDKVNYLVRSGCNLTEISTSSLTARLRHLIHHR